jgi:hypothetical protein
MSLKGHQPSNRYGNVTRAITEGSIGTKQSAVRTRLLPSVWRIARRA